MKEILYHPLVDADTDGTEKVPTFCCPNEKMVKRSHKLYLEEILPNIYRLCSSEPVTAEDSAAFSVRCPHCSHHLTPVTKPSGGLRHTLFECRECLPR